MSKRTNCNRIVPSTLYIGERERRSRIPPTERWEVREGETCDRKGIRGEGKENGCRGKSTDESSVFKIPMRLRGFAFSSTREKKAADVRECGRKGDAMVGSGGCAGDDRKDGVMSVIIVVVVVVVMVMVMVVVVVVAAVEKATLGEGLQSTDCRGDK